MNLERLQEVFAENFAERGEIGASVSVWRNGEEVVTLSDGWCEREQERPWTDETLVPVYSVSKVPAAATFLLVLREAGLTGEDLVRRVWPELQVGDLTFFELLSHRAGLPGVDGVVQVSQRAEVVTALEKTEPFWEPGLEHGYHARSIGFLLDELCERLMGRRLGECFRQWVGDPLDLDFWIGLPEKEFPRVAKLYPGRYLVRREEKPFYEAMQTEGSAARRAFGSLKGYQSASEMNDPAAWAGGFPAFGGVGSARALAKFYQAVLGNTAAEVFPAEVRAELATRLIQGPDQVMNLETSFGPGPMFDPMREGQKLRMLFGPHEGAFGHPGAGGSHAFCDPESGLSFAYTMNQMELGLFPGERGVGLLRTLF
ncbi:serine hydrolase domain-containing protein [Roseibacillus ishigakijimensis]|uniref:Beta-lactamase family protein n=1 Tax=Roseibacillus ishigakijimensis TaxID=454146 RepID=A0A934VML3_9BACT|nr:serine hydrolase domain-containing protein [Roseibacillus ishigakijimensis]MBK1834211.1 beta-lactamase family protein [Roseibacillus ishigakijimensis]